MSKGLKWRGVIASLVVIFGLVTVLPNFVDMGDRWWPTKKAMKYGLDIQGGLHLVMGVDIEGMLDETVLRTISSLEQGLKNETIQFKSVVRHPTDKSWMVIELNQGADQQKILTYLEKDWLNVQVVEEDGNRIVVRFLDSYISNLKERTMEQAIETIRNRIDEFGVSEPSITAQGSDRILVQLPGIEDSSRAKELINKTARLTFMLVSKTSDPARLSEWISEAEKEGKYDLSKMKYSDYVIQINKDIKAKLPPDTVVRFGKNEAAPDMQTAKIPYLLETKDTLGGESLKDSFVTTGQYNEPEVSLSFNPDGTRRFADITGNNVGRQLAIVLDDVVFSAPNLQTKIANGSARITLGGGRDYKRMIEEAKMISMALRAGALPARLEQLEERTIGPTLGADSIQKGVKASVVAAVLVFLFMLIYYRFFGFLADFGLSINVLLTLAILTLLDATLTLPGIAGIALTLGIAVDANVIIFERIKEELRKGASPQVAVKEGFGRAFSAIFDANIVTSFTCVILIYYGNGPVRGFGVTLLIGIICSLFTAVFMTRTIVDLLVARNREKALSI